MRKSRLRHYISLCGVLGYGAIVLLITMWPRHVDEGLEGLIAKVLRKLHEHGVPDWFGYGELEFSANVLMFIPLGFFLALLLSQRFWWLAVLIGPAFSAAIEAAQYVYLDDRTADVSDFISNSIGALLGALVAFIIRALVYHRDRMLIDYELWRRGLDADATRTRRHHTVV